MAFTHRRQPEALSHIPASADERARTGILRNRVVTGLRRVGYLEYRVMSVLFDPCRVTVVLSQSQRQLQGCESRGIHGRGTLERVSSHRDPVICRPDNIQVAVS